MGSSFLNIEVTDNTGFGNFGETYDQIMAPIFADIGAQVAADAQSRAAVGATGDFRDSIVSSGPVKDDAGILSVYVYSDLPDQVAAAVQEGVDPETGQENAQGRRAGAAFPNVSALIIWIEAVLGLDDKAANEAAYPIGLKISQEGLPSSQGEPHFRPIGNAFIDNMDSINEQIDAGLDAVLSGFASGVSSEIFAG
jgi:hypothetical protein